MNSHPYLLGAACAAPVLYLAFAKWARPKPIPGIPHYPIASILGDIPRVTEDMRVYGNIFDGGGFYNEASKQERRFGRMVSLKSDDVWRKHRRVMNPLMTSKYLKSMTPAIAENARVLVRGPLEKQDAKGQVQRGHLLLM
ncbi:hypothetical protein FRC01_011193 [Tulasnella sp. 417]|nr:hypothetical protein FRC01_011193 [Tulasnella sp. 417]